MKTHTSYIRITAVRAIKSISAHPSFRLTIPKWLSNFNKSATVGGHTDSALFYHIKLNTLSKGEYAQYTPTLLVLCHVALCLICFCSYARAIAVKLLTYNIVLTSVTVVFKVLSVNLSMIVLTDS